jgi:hypothetical protein
MDKLEKYRDLEKISQAWVACAQYEQKRRSQGSRELRIAVDQLYRVATFGIDRPRYRVARKDNGRYRVCSF